MLSMEPTHGTAVPTAIPIVMMTPSWALKILSHNENNRTVRQTRVDRYARDMTVGRWILTGDPIVIDRNGNLVQGQHRLLACIASGAPFQVPLLEGVEPHTWNVMDTGVARTLGDVLRREGWKNPVSEAATINAILRWASGAMTTAWTLSHQEAIDFAAANPEVAEATRRAVLFRQSDVRGWNTPFLAALSFFTIQHDKENHDEFFAAAKTGVGLYDGHPVLALRRWSARSAEAKGSQDRTYTLALYIKAWNAFITQRTVNILAWKRGGAGGNREDFPSLIDANNKPIPLTYLTYRGSDLEVQS